MNRHLSRSWIVPVLVGLVALVPRWQWAVMPHPHLFSDPEDYHQCAVGLLDGRGMVQEEKYRAYRPPLYPLFLAAVYALTGPDEDSAYLVQALIGSLSCALFAYFLRRLFHPSSTHPKPDENSWGVMQFPSPKPGGGLGRGLKSITSRLTGIFQSTLMKEARPIVPSLKPVIITHIFPAKNSLPQAWGRVRERVERPISSYPFYIKFCNVLYKFLPLPSITVKNLGNDHPKPVHRILRINSEEVDSQIQTKNNVKNRLIREINQNRVPETILNSIPLLGGLGLAFSRDQIFFTATIMSETLFVFLSIAWLVTLIEWRERRSWGWIAGMGFLLGLMTLCRPVALGYLPVAMVMAWAHREISTDSLAALNRSRGIRILLMLCMMVLPILPWTIRNFVVLGRYVPIATNGGVNFYIGHHPGYSYWSTGEKEAIRQKASLDEVDESALFFQLGMQYIIANPEQSLSDSLLKLHYLFTTEIPPWPWGERGTEVGFERLSWFVWLRWNPFWAVLAGGGMALCLLKDNAKYRFIVGIVACHVAMTVLFFARSRFRVPLDPLLLTAALIALLSIFSIVTNRWQKQAVTCEN